MGRPKGSKNRRGPKGRLAQPVDEINERARQDPLPPSEPLPDLLGPEVVEVCLADHRHYPKPFREWMLCGNRAYAIQTLFPKRAPPVLVYWTGWWRVFAEEEETYAELDARRSRLRRYLLNLFFPSGVEKGQNVRFSVCVHKIGGFTVIVMRPEVVHLSICVPPELLATERPTVWPLIQVGMPSHGKKLPTHLCFLPRRRQTDFARFAGPESTGQKPKKKVGPKGEEPTVADETDDMDKGAETVARE